MASIAASNTSFPQIVLNASSLCQIGCSLFQTAVTILRALPLQYLPQRYACPAQKAASSTSPWRDWAVATTVYACRRCGTAFVKCPHPPTAADGGFVMSQFAATLHISWLKYVAHLLITSKSYTTAKSVSTKLFQHLIPGTAFNVVKWRQTQSEW